MMKRLISYLPSFIAGSALFGIGIALSRQLPSLSEVSGLKGVYIGAFFAISVYFFISSVMKRIRYINNVILINLLLIFCGAELVLRLFSSSLPVSIVAQLPTTARNTLLSERGLFVHQNLQGEGLLYSWRPNSDLKQLPWVRVDRHGYRNPYIPTSADIVLLGDSVTISVNSRRDIADHFRASKRKVINLGFSGYGPFHQRDAYKRYILDANIPHKVVVVNFCYCNDITDAQSYERLSRQNAGWETYLGTTPTRAASPFPFDPPWTVSILFNLPYLVVQTYRDHDRTTDVRSLAFSRGTISNASWMTANPSKPFTSAQWRPALNALSDIVQMAHNHNAKAIIAYYPDLGQLYRPGLQPSDPIAVQAQQTHRNAVIRLQTFAEDIGASFIDYTSALQAHNDIKLVTVNEGDYHPNDAGVETMYTTLSDEVVRISQ